MPKITPETTRLKVPADRKGYRANYKVHVPNKKLNVRTAALQVLNDSQDQTFIPNSDSNGKQRSTALTLKARVGSFVYLYERDLEGPRCLRMSLIRKASF